MPGIRAEFVHQYILRFMFLTSTDSPLLEIYISCMNKKETCTFYNGKLVVFALQTTRNGNQ